MSRPATLGAWWDRLETLETVRSEAYYCNPWLFPSTQVESFTWQSGWFVCFLAVLLQGCQWISKQMCFHPLYLHSEEYPITTIACENTPSTEHGPYVLVHTINWMWLIGWVSQWYPRKYFWYPLPYSSLSTEHHKDNSSACMGMLWKTCWGQECENKEKQSWKLTMLYQGGMRMIEMIYSLIRTSCGFPWL